MTTRKQGLSLGLTSIAAFVLLTGCTTTPPGGEASTPPASEAPPSSSPIPTQTSNPSATPTSSLSPQPSATPVETTATPESIDTSSWKTFKSFGVQFNYPAGWKVEADDCSGCKPETHDNPYETWEVKNDQGQEVLNFFANSAMDTDGNVSTYKRTELERTPVLNTLAKKTHLVAEHQVLTSAKSGKTKSKLQVFLIDADVYAKRTENPELEYFFAKADQWSIFWSTDDFIEGLGMDDDHVSLEQAKKILEMPEYATLRAILLSTKAHK